MGRVRTAGVTLPLLVRYIMFVRIENGNADLWEARR